MRRVVISLLVVLMSAQVLWSQSIIHYFGFSLDGSYAFLFPSALLTKGQEVSTSLSFAYELRNGHFLFQTGLGAQYANNRFDLSKTQLTFPQMIDSENEQCAVQVGYTNGTVQGYHYSAVLPLLVGGSYRRFYFLGGVKGMWSFDYHATLSGNYSVSATYPYYSSALTDMPEHYLVTDSEVRAGFSNRMVIYVAPSVEVGGVLWRNRVGMGRLAVFADYRIPIVSPYQQLSHSLPSMTNASTVVLADATVMQNVLASANATSILPQALSVGLKFTVLFRLLPSYERCHCAGW